MSEYKKVNIDMRKDIWIEISVLAARKEKTKVEMLNEIFLDYLEREGVKLPTDEK